MYLWKKLCTCGPVHRFFSNKWVMIGLQKFHLLQNIAVLYYLVHLFRLFPFRQLINHLNDNKWQQPIDSHGPGWKMSLNYMLAVARWTDCMFLCTALISGFSSSHSGALQIAGQSCGNAARVLFPKCNIHSLLPAGWTFHLDCTTSATLEAGTMGLVPYGRD